VPPAETLFVREGVVANNEAGKHLKILVYNCGLLRLRGVGGGIIFENPPLADERFASLAAAILSSGADLVALTEIYEDAHVSELLKAVAGTYPNHARGDPRSTMAKKIKFHNGLMYLTKAWVSIEESRCIRHKEAAAMEKILGDKAMLIVKVSAGDLGRICLVNMHTTAGGGLDPEAVDKVRESELEEAVKEVGKAMIGGCKGIILGDLNMGPEASPINYQFMLEQGYRDEVISCVPEEKHKNVMTWDPANPLNSVGPHAKSPPQRCDHIFIHHTAGLISSSAEMMYTEATIETANGLTTLSDHYGLQVHLQEETSGY
jgi:endonuclease/exonuclease/phosphatase family metal-dependent hydrolase